MMNLKIIKSNYTEEMVKSLLTPKKVISLSSKKQIMVSLLPAIVTLIITLICLPPFYQEVLENIHSYVWNILMITSIPYLAMVCAGIYCTYFLLVARKKKEILSYYREMDRMYQDLTVNKIKAQIEPVHTEYCIDWENGNLTMIMKSKSLGVKHVYHFGKHLQDFTNVSQSTIDLSKFDIIYGLYTVTT